MLQVVCSRSNLKIAEIDTGSLEETVFLGARDNSSIDDFLRVMSLDSALVPEEYKAAAELVGIPKDDQLLAVPLLKLQRRKESIRESLSSVLSDEKNLAYLTNFITIRRFLDSMHPCLVDDLNLQEIIDEQKHAGVKNNLQSFSNSKSEKVTYSMASSSTGRLSVTSGPKVLTAPSIVKSVLKSRFIGGSVLQIDLSCAEPNFALFVAGQDTMAGLYSHIAKEVLLDEVDRKTAKLITLSALYGQSTQNLKKQLPPNVHPAGVIKKVKRFLCYNSLLSDLTSQLKKLDLRNFLERPLRVDKERLLISHYLQSSVAEAAIVMFDRFCADNKDVVPLFVIHDALIIDCKKPDAENLLSSPDFALSFAGKKFPATVSKLGT